MATNGNWNGSTSTDIGVSESSGTPAGESLQLMGTGNNYNDFTWVDPARDTYGFVNANQTLTAIPEPGTLGALTLLAAVGLIRRRK